MAGLPLLYPGLLLMLTFLVAAQYDYRTLFYNQQVDHFSFHNSDKFQQRYLISDVYWNHKGGPILFYTGNEGDIAWFCNNTGFMWDLAPEFQGLVICAEHRYYGQSMPYGDLSYKEPQYLGYLGSEQALADFAELVLHLKATIPGAEKSPVIAFGGSYGGMLASWARIKYPHIFAGAIASSAPILQFTGVTACDVFNKIVTKDFSSESPECSKTIRNSWDAINRLGQSDSGRQFLTDTFSLCNDIVDDKGIIEFKQWLNNIYGNLAMVNYPYAANFLEPLPAWPIREVCTFLTNSSLPDQELLLSLSSAVNLYFNYTGTATCYNTSVQATGDLGDYGWFYQSCTEMVMPMCTDGVSDMFEPAPWEIDTFSLQCQNQFNVTPRVDQATLLYGGRNLRAASNIVFTNGLLDPWSGGGVLDNVSDTVVAIVIPEGAHHLDLRSANPEDPESVIAARNAIRTNIRKWISEARRDDEDVLDDSMTESWTENDVRHQIAIAEEKVRQGRFYRQPVCQSPRQYLSRRSFPYNPYHRFFIPYQTSGSNGV